MKQIKLLLKHFLVFALILTLTMPLSSCGRKQAGNSSVPEDAQSAIEEAQSVIEEALGTAESAQEEALSLVEEAVQEAESVAFGTPESSEEEGQAESQENQGASAEAQQNAGNAAESQENQSAEQESEGILTEPMDPEQPEQPGGSAGSDKNDAAGSGKNDAAGAAQNTAEEVPEEASQITEDGEYTSKEEVAEYIHLYGHLPDNYITKKEAEAMGWVSNKGNLWKVAPGKSIGGSRFGNYEKLLPEKKGRKYYECDIDFDGKYRGAKRIIYSNDGLIFYTDDHYETFEQLY